MNLETNRLNTFANWPASAPVDPIRIAKAGFFYTGEGTEVQCFSCGGKISNWNYGDQVVSRHRIMEPTCAFVVNPQLSGNIPLVLGRECPVVNESTDHPSIEETSNSTESQDYGLTEEDEMYKSDALRLLSFINWNDLSVSRESLVNAGFYHAGEGRLRCAWCGGELAPFRNFESIGDPLDVHRMYFPRCTHAATLHAARNNTTSLSLPSTPSYTPPIQSPLEATPSSQLQSSGAAHNERLLSGNSTWRALGVVGSGARHPTHAALSARLATFERWPADRPQTPRALADAGFFYTGTDDQVRCFYCDGGLGKWEAGDAPWVEHGRWFPHCGYVLLVRGQQFLDSCRANGNNDDNAPATEGRETRGASSVHTARRSNSNFNFPVNDSQIEECMESEAALAALGAGLDAARVRRAIVRRLRVTGMAFSSSEALIDAVLDEQLNEEAWSVSPRSQRLARDILAETLRDFVPRSGLVQSAQDDSSDSRVSPYESPTRSPIRGAQSTQSEPSNTNTESPNSSNNITTVSRIESENVREVKEDSPVKKKELTLEEENRQLKEARLCKVCMDSEVSVVFLPCGHLVSCGGCGAALAACPLCRCAVRALVRAYLAWYVYITYVISVCNKSRERVDEALQ